MSETISGIIERVTYHNPENGFAVLRVHLPNQSEVQTVIGHTAHPTAGEHLTATGRWTMDINHGAQFKAETMQTSSPNSAEGIERYLASGAIRSIGPQLAKRIVEVHGSKTLDILENYSDFLLHIQGIGKAKLKKIRESWREQQEVRRIMLFLHEHGIASSRAVKIYRTYGENAIETIQANPYRLADEIRGIGFKSADEIAHKLGFDPQAPLRAKAAIRYTLNQCTNEGHCCFPRQQLLAATAELVAIPAERIEAALEESIQAGHVLVEQDDEETWIFLPSLQRAEQQLAQSVRRLLAADQHPLPVEEIEERIQRIEAKFGMPFAEAQRQALKAASKHQFLIITGGPGVGKTTVVKGIIELFQSQQLRCTLAAPTGRAAKRLTETTNLQASTIHRLLEFDPARGEFKRQARFPLEGDLFVLDEVSMVDVALMNQFLRAIPDDACVILVGDEDQLPSVGPGRVLHDLIHAQTVPVVRLTEIFRQSKTSEIVQAAYAIHRGELPAKQQREELSDFYWIEAEEPEEIQDKLIRLVTERIPKRFGFDPMRDIQILSPMNRALLGARNLNQIFQAQLNPEGKPEVERFGVKFRVGDRVMQRENNYQREMYNGDLGRIAKINLLDQEVIVHSEGREVGYDFADLDELALAYVLSIHKSQGSEYPCVVIPLHTQHFRLLQRNLLYTAVTRGKQLVIVVGSRKAFGISVSTINSAPRFSRLLNRLQGG